MMKFMTVYLLRFHAHPNIDFPISTLLSTITNTNKNIAGDPEKNVWSQTDRCGCKLYIPVCGRWILIGMQFLR